MNTKVESVEKSEAALREEAVQAFWQEHNVFKQSIETPAGSAPVGDFVFYDGPPFATGLPHYGHILAGTIKDAVPRFWTMNGYRVRRKWGWDCHGLPLENLIEKKLGLATKRDIEAYGIQNFNEQARDAVMEFADDWREIIPRMGRFVDMDDDYKTMDSSYTESVWWVFSQLHEKGLVYEGFKGMHLCPRCGTTLSNFEVNQGYKDIKDISVYVKLKLNPGQKYGSGYDTDETVSLLVWTTTPWTLPGNMAAAVHPEGEYAVVRVEEELIILAKENVASVLGGAEHEIVHDGIKGSELVGLQYEPPFDYYQSMEFEHKENAWQVYPADYVEIGGAGSGLVHLAPAYGEEDMELAKAHQVPIVHHVDPDGHFMDHITDFKAQLVKPKDDDEAGVTHLDADIEIVKALKANERLLKKENITHSYPHCWRCDTPLLNYATTSWFVEVTKIRDELVAANDAVHWVPEHVGKARFGKWLEGARDWAVSRQRYWGAPLPVWRNPDTKEIKVFSSLADAQAYMPKSGNTYVVMRHGESDSNVAGIISANIENDDHVTDAGKIQVQKTAAELKDQGIDLIITSPFVRTKETAEIMREALGLEESAVVEDEQIREYDLADSFEGKRWHDDYSKPNFANWEERFTKELPGSENRRDVMRRMGAFLYALEEKYQGKKILIVSHGGPIATLRAVANGWGVAEQKVDYENGRYFKNAQWEELPFTPMPHNDNFELDFHRPYIDDVVLEEDGVRLERVPDVFDCWFESGSMPYAETHYPFENLDIANMAEGVRFPADFISESVDQTRGWFYSLMVLGVALFGKSPFEHVITNGLVLAEDGKKMSKKLQNYPDPVELVDRQGADSMRFYLLSSPIIKGEDLNFSEKEVQELQRKNIGRLHNVLAMYEMYADGTKATTDSTHVLDRWMISRVATATSEITAGFKHYELDKATRPLTDLIDDLSVWYLRRSRDRLKGEDAADKQLALGTLRYTLQTIAGLMAPSMPFYAEHLWQAVRAEDEASSVHLSAWPEEVESDQAVLEQMEKVRYLVSSALEFRSEANIKVRQPLQSMHYSPDGEALSEELKKIVAAEVNVKEVLEQLAKSAGWVTLDTTITPDLQMEGDARELIRGIQSMRKEAGLEPGDRIALTIQTSDGGEAVVRQFETDIMSTVGAEELTFGDADGTEVAAGTHEFTVEIKAV